jgi:hypothetical protein
VPESYSDFGVVDPAPCCAVCAQWVAGPRHHGGALGRHGRSRWGVAGGGIHGVGYPSMPADEGSRYIVPEVEEVRTIGGASGNGVITRDSLGNWRWTPD